MFIQSRRAATAAFVLVASACGGGTGPDDTLSITTASLVSAVEGVPYSAEIEASGGGGTYAWTVASGDLPPGLALDSSTGVVAGTPTGTVASTFTVQVASGDGQIATRQLTLDVFAELSIETVELPAAREATPYAQILSATGGNGSYTWTTVSGSLPGGLSIGASTGAVSGTPVAAQDATFRVRVQSGDGQAAESDLSISVLGLLAVTPTIPNAVEGVLYSHALGVVGGDGPYTWSIVTGTPPDGLSLDATSGIISGVPTTLGSSNFTVEVDSGDGQTARAPLSIGVFPLLAISTSSVAGGKENVPYADGLAASGGDGVYTWSISTGTLPAGLALQAGTGSITGTPTSLGQRSFSVVVESGDGQSAEGDFSIDVSALVLLPNELCSENPATAHVTFADGNLETTVRRMLGGPAQTTLTCALVATLWGLNAGNAGITDLTGIQNLVGLQSTSLADNSISDLGPLASMTQLEGLNLSGNPLTGLAPLSGLVELNTLFAEGSQVSDITPLAGLIALEQLELADNSIDDVTALSGLSDLTVLDLSDNDLSVIGALGTSKALTWLDLRRNSIVDVGPLSGLTALEHLDLTFNSITDIEPLSDLTTLSVLGLGFNPLTDITELAVLSRLTHLNIQGNSIADISAVAGMSSLQSLVASANDITDISALAGLTALTLVSLDSNVDLDDIQALIDNPGIGAGDLVTLDTTGVPCAQIDTLVAKGPSVVHNCPT